MTIKNLSLRPHKKPEPPKEKKIKFYQSRAARDAERALNKIERASIKAVSIVHNRVDREGVLEAYEGIEAAREIRELMTKIFSDFSRSATFRRLASARSKRPPQMRRLPGKE